MAATSSRTVSDVASFNGTLAVPGLGVKDATVNTNGDTFQIGAIVSNLTQLANSATALSVDNTSTAASTLTGICQLNGGTVNTGATLGSLSNVIASVNDSATKGLTFTDQSVRTNGASVMTYKLGATANNVYVTTRQTIRFFSNVIEANAGSSITK